MGRRGRGREADSGAGVGRAESRRLWLQGPWCSGNEVCTLVCGAKSRVPWWVHRAVSRIGYGSVGLEAAGLLVVGLCLFLLAPWPEMFQY